MSEVAKTAGGGGGVRERILMAALGILRERGIQDLSQVQVARRAGVRQSHVTYYFPTRHDLLEAVSGRFIGGLEAALGAVAREVADDPAALLRHLAAPVVDREHMRMFTGVVVEADRDPALREMVVRNMRRMQASLAERLGGDPQRAALVMAALWGMGLYGLMMPEPADAEASASFLGCVAGWAGGGVGSGE